MSEGTKDSMLLITISWQALQRAFKNNPKTVLCDSTVVTLFACFFIESNLNYIVDGLNIKHDMDQFLNKDNPGLLDKLGWFYNKFIAKKKAKSRDEMFKQGIVTKLRRRYPGFTTLYKFRNDLSHGKINNTVKSIAKVQKLRQQAKNIVDDLFFVVARAGFTLPRDITYQDSIK